MGTDLSVMVDMLGQNAAQMGLVEEHDVVEALAMNRTDDALNICVLPK